MHADSRLMDEHQRALAARLLRENIARQGVCRAVGVSIRWLIDVMGACFEAAPEHRHGQLPNRSGEVIMRRVGAEGDEVCSVVKQKANEPWRWLAMERSGRQIIAVHVGDRRRDRAKRLRANLPAVYREQAIFSTDQDEVYTGMIPAARKAITKKARKTHHLERFNTTLRQRVSQLVRETLAYSKQVENPSGAIRYFTCDDNLMRPPA